MNTIHQRFSNRFRTQWAKIKFFSDKPDLNDVQRLKNGRFCEAITQAVAQPMIIDRNSIDCPDSREYAQISKNRLVVGVPKDQFDLIASHAGR